MKTHEHDCTDSLARKRADGDRAARHLRTHERRGPVRQAKGKDARTTLSRMPKRSRDVELVAQSIVGCVVVSAVGDLVEADRLGALAPSSAGLGVGVSVPLRAG